MKALIYKTKSEAEAKNKELTSAVKHLFDEKTIDYSYVLKHPTKQLYAVPLDTRFTQELSKLTGGSVELTSDWFPKNDEEI